MAATEVGYSIVIPVFNEADGLPELCTRLKSVMNQIGDKCEIVLVDDGSADGSAELIKNIRAEDGRFKLVELSRNFGHQAAVTAGLDFASGDAVIVMDADLQDPPEVVMRLIEKWKEGFDVVYAVRSVRRGESIFKRSTAHFFYRVLRRLANIDIPKDVGDFRLMDRRAVELFRKFPERNRYVRGLVSWLGLRQAGVEYERDPRHAGSSKYSLAKLLRFALIGIIGFSDTPLILIMFLGFFFSISSFFMGLAAIFCKVTGIYTVTGWTSMIVVISFIGGIQLFVTGVVGLYIGRVYEETKGRPHYITQEIHGLKVPESSYALFADSRN